ncbi:DEHA2D00594p [Debaryomyces hansenii CBS767]|uniref:DEHA2D00594p n=1 Tax=Debaryomyces hansenii (strain ATCC 36239 / CBS 767 / BCRC 21394 / JCM 1990 / NBRC 0083 / IGC 2968) TaxID=284592 RepID=Q6BTH5_DEBHA|nr:DEHA2D00594p [Debaryomyces hansenii CBS767]CAG86607.2 DEHA2D00594p [Debaryomyces hansenii CBS767]|eukprot:XP_458494.2 DEHA2D00594p [Debaryomyces hansenii CBS767]
MEANIHLNKKNEIGSYEIAAKKALVEEYKRLLQLVDQKHITESEKLEEINQKTSFIESNQISNALQVGALNTKIGEASRSENLLFTYLKPIIIKYVDR